MNEAMRLMEMSKDSLNPAHDVHSRYGIALKLIYLSSITTSSVEETCCMSH